jgi:predicted hotdog family 3-hydroxylacyl-ACP dehydratase
MNDDTTTTAPEWLTIEEAAAALGVGWRSIYRYKLKRHQRPEGVRLRRRSVEAFGRRLQRFEAMRARLLHDRVA